MRNTLILAALLIPALTFSQNAEQNKVNNTIKAMFDGLSNLSIEQVKNNSTEDLVIFEHGMIWNMDTLSTIINALKDFNPVRVNSFEFLKTEIQGQTAWVAYLNKATVTTNVQKVEYKWLESAVLVKQGNDWKVKMLHSTRLSPKKE
ncbi:MAG TPA: nuclear transport factor 2 family protein [Chitinophagaceae bacterium]|nr:nuclear transport factor 2 family protein [Chitinophagaceae bacterium]